MTGYMVFYHAAAVAFMVVAVPVLATSASSDYRMAGANPQQTSTISSPLASTGNTFVSFSVPGGEPLQGSTAIHTHADGSTRMYFTSLSGTLFALEVAAGTYGTKQLFGSGVTEVWKQDIGSVQPGVGPTVSEDGQFLYIGTQKNTFIALNTSDGSRFWHSDVSTGGPVSASATLKDNVLYFGDKHYDFYAVDAMTGDVLYSCQAKGPINAPAAVSSDGKTAWFADMDYNVYQLTYSTAVGGCIPSASCEFCMDFQITAQSSLNQAAVIDEANQLVYITAPGEAQTTGGTSVYDLTNPGGTPLALNNCSEASEAAPVYSANRNAVYAACGAQLSAIDVTHARNRSFSLLWSFMADSVIENTPIASDHTIIFNDANGYMYGVNVENGRQQFKRKVGGVVEGQPAVTAEGSACVGTTNGLFLCVGSASGANILVVRILAGICAFFFLIFVAILVSTGCSKKASGVESRGAAGGSYGTLAGEP